MPDVNHLHFAYPVFMCILLIHAPYFCDICIFEHDIPVRFHLFSGWCAQAAIRDRIAVGECLQEVLLRPLYHLSDGFKVLCLVELLNDRRAEFEVDAAVL